MQRTLFQGQWFFLKHNLKGFLYFHKHHNIIWPVDSGSWLLVTPWFLNYVFLCCPQFFSQDVLFQLHLVQLVPLSLGRNWPSLRSLMTSLQLSPRPSPVFKLIFPPPLHSTSPSTISCLSKCFLISAPLGWVQFSSSAIYLSQPLFGGTQGKSSKVYKLSLALLTRVCVLSLTLDIAHRCHHLHSVRLRFVIVSRPHVSSHPSATSRASPEMHRFKYHQFNGASRTQPWSHSFRQVTKSFNLRHA